MVRKKSNDKNKRGPGRPRKRGRPPKKKQPGNKSPEKPKGLDYEKLLQTGKIAKIKIYQGYISRIVEGEQLKPSELKNFHTLERELEEFLNGKSKDPELIQSFADAAKYCGVSTRTISYHVKRGSITQNQDGTFEKSILDNYKGRRNKGRRLKSIDQITSKTINQDNQEKTFEEKKEIAELRFRLAKAKNEEIELQKKQKKLIPAEDVKSAWMKIVIAARVKLMSIKSRVTPIVVDNFDDRQSANLCLKEIEMIIEEVLKELASEKII